MNAAQLADGIKAAIEAATPADKAGEDDVFRVTVGLDTVQHGSRVGILTINGGIKSAGRVHRCNTWQTSAELVMFYSDVPAEAGRWTALQVAVADAEIIAEALYDWAFAEADVERIELDEANASDNGDGQIQITRSIRMEYTRG